VATRGKRSGVGSACPQAFAVGTGLQRNGHASLSVAAKTRAPQAVPLGMFFLAP
jgi:hypothetical protein